MVCSSKCDTIQYMPYHSCITVVSQLAIIFLCSPTIVIVEGDTHTEKSFTTYFWGDFCYKNFFFPSLSIRIFKIVNFNNALLLLQPQTHWDRACTRYEHFVSITHAHTRRSLFSIPLCSISLSFSFSIHLAEIFI